MAADRTHDHHNPHQGADPRAVTPSDGQSPVCAPILDRRQLIGEVITLVLCGPSALLVLVLVAWQGWPPWWLVVAGMLIAWAGDALWTVGDHTVGVGTRRRCEQASRGDHP